MDLPDPSLQDDYTETYQKEIKATIENQQVKIEDQVMVRLFKKNTTETYKIQLTSEANVSFFYRCLITRSHYEQYMKQESISKRRNFTEWFAGFFSQREFKYVFQLVNQAEAQLIILEEEKYKRYELIRFTFQLVQHKQLKMNIMFRYQNMKLRKDYLDQYWKQMVHIVKTKNPSLLLQLQSRTKKNVFK